MTHTKAQFAFFSLFITLFVILVFILVFDSAWAEDKNTQVQTVSLLSESNPDSLFLLSKNQKLIQNIDNSNEIIFPEVNTDFEFNSLGIKFKKINEQSKNIKFYIKTENTDWLMLEVMEDTGIINNQYLFTDPLFATGNKIQAKLEYSDILNIATNDIELIYFNTHNSPSFKPLKTISSIYKGVTANEEVQIITREEWEANEDYRTWKPQYEEPKAFVIHHTAGSSGGEDPAATVRAIYYWHAVVLGWGDIGYNYLVDQQGNVYEGRYGGDKVIAAHTYDSVNNVNYNEGTIGISVLGCFEDEKSGCNTPSEYNETIQETITSLIASKAASLDISLEGKRKLFDESINAIVGHRDLDYTLCPGNIIQEELTTIRTLAQEKKSIILEEDLYQGEFQEHNFVKTYQLDTTNEISVTYENTGDLAWEAEKVYLRIRNKKSKNKQKKYITEDVEPGQTYTFTLVWEAKKMGKQNLALRLYNEDEFMTNSAKKVSVKVNNPSQAELTQHDMPVAILSPWDPQVTITYKNIGSTNWTNEDTNLFINGKNITSLYQDVVKPNQYGTVKFNLKQISDLKTGDNKLIIYLKQGKRRIQYSRFINLLRID